MATANIILPTINRQASTDARTVMDCYRAAPPQFVLTIETDYVGPTDTTGSCFRAEDTLHHSIHFEAAQYDLTTVENHLSAAIGLIQNCRFATYQLLSYESTETGYQFSFARLEG